jgi:hypothetical protein
VFGFGKRADHFVTLKMADQASSFWLDDPAKSNLQIKNWATETLKIRGTRSKTKPKSLSQNKLALAWKSDQANSKIRIDRESGKDQLKYDGEAQKRHEEAVFEANRLLESMAGYHNSLGDIGLDIHRYLEAMGNDLKECSPSLSVHRGEKLRTLFLRRIENDRNLDEPVLRDDIQEKFLSWRSAHNLFVLLDPLMEKMDRATFGPDQEKSQIEGNDVSDFATAMKARMLLEKSDYDTLNDLVYFNAVESGSTARHHRWMTESVRNVLIEVINLAWKHPKVAAGALGITIIVGPATAVAVSVGVAAAVTFVKDFHPKLNSVFADSPNMLKLVKLITDSTKS